MAPPLLRKLAYDTLRIQNNQSNTIMSVFATIFTSLISPVTNYFTKREEGRQLKSKAEAKFKSAKQAGQLDVTLTDAEWESISVSKQDSSWKDELITITFMLPIICIFLGSVWAAFTVQTLARRHMLLRIPLS